MLILTRKLSEKIKIGENIIVTVIECRNGKVVLGFDAPHNVPIMRTELLEQGDDDYPPNRRRE